MRELITGIIQGITEFLPISSSGHLVLIQNLLKISRPGIELEIILHIATLIAVCIFFFKEIKNLFTRKKLLQHPLFLIFLGSVPAGIVGILFKDKIETYFENINLLPYFFLLNSLILFSTLLRKKNEIREVRVLHAIFIGIAQAVALLPGVSRSGSTVSIALLLGLEPQVAFSFSFLLSIPAILGATLIDLPELSAGFSASMSLGFIAALITGLLSLYLLKRILRIRKLFLFGFYTLALSMVIMIFLR